jgi:hypothetical protein
MGEIVRTETGWSIRPSVRAQSPVAAHPGAMLPKGRLVRVSFNMVLPHGATKAQIEEWASFELGAGSMDEDNPLGNFSFEVSGELTLEDLCAETDVLDLREEALASYKAKAFP